MEHDQTAPAAQAEDKTPSRIETVTEVVEFLSFAFAALLIVAIVVATIVVAIVTGNVLPVLEVIGIIAACAFVVLLLAKVASLRENRKGPKPPEPRWEPDPRLNLFMEAFPFITIALVLISPSAAAVFLFGCWLFCGVVCACWLSQSIAAKVKSRRA